MTNDLLKSALCVLAILISTAATAHAQKQITPPAPNASITEVEKWLVESLPKYATYKTRTASVTVSEVSMTGCTLKFVQSKKTGVTTSVTEGAKRTVSAAKDEVSIDLRSLTTEKIAVVDYLYDDLQVLEIKYSPDEPVMEMIVKRSAAEAIRSALAAAAHLCGDR